MKHKLIILHLQLPAHDKRTFQVDVADVGDYQLPIGVFAIYDGVLQLEGGKLIVGRGRLQNRHFGNVLDLAVIDGGDSRVGVSA